MTPKAWHVEYETTTGTSVEGTQFKPESIPSSGPREMEFSCTFADGATMILRFPITGKESPTEIEARIRSYVEQVLAEFALRAAGGEKAQNSDMPPDAL